jgi:hypothetical protein
VQSNQVGESTHGASPNFRMMGGLCQISWNHGCNLANPRHDACETRERGLGRQEYRSYNVIQGKTAAAPPRAAAVGMRTDGTLSVKAKVRGPAEAGSCVPPFAEPCLLLKAVSVPCFHRASFSGERADSVGVFSRSLANRAKETGSLYINGANDG